MTERRRYCPSCGAALHGPFCSECGRSATLRGGAPRPALWPYAVVFVLLLALVVTIVMTRRATTAARSAAPAAPASPTVPAPAVSPGSLDRESASGRLSPDSSAMTPLERFDSLFDRVMRANEGADTATVKSVAPAALAAYDQLVSPDVDARFHAGLVRIAAGDLAGAMTLAASIAAERPGHLFGFLLRGRVAEENRDQAALAAVQREFLQVYPAETAAQRPEYEGHQIVIDQFLKAATK